MRDASTSVAAVLIVVLGAASADAASEAEKCTAAKMKAAAQFASGRLLADAKAETSGVLASYAKCDQQQAAAFAKAEEKYGADCLTTGDGAGVQADVATTLSCVSAGLVGAPADCSLATAQSCGNGVVDAGEVCDGRQLGTATCASLTGGVQNQGTLGCGPGCGSFDTSECRTCPAADATVMNGVCWILGATGASCTATCATHGLVYDDQTRTYAGSEGFLATCSNLLLTLGADEPNTIEAFSVGGSGCVAFATSWRRDTTPTTAEGAVPVARRACACH